MKKLVIIFMLVLFSLTAVFAVNEEVGEDINLYKGTLGIGLATDFSSDIAVSVTGDLGKLELLGSAGIGFGQSSFHFALDAGVTYEIIDVDFGLGGHMPISMGLIIPMNFNVISKNFNFDISLCPVFEIEYQIPSTPLSFNIYAGPYIEVSGLGQQGRTAVSGGLYGRAVINYWL